ncbi:inositol polyphosphate 1-phosphatase [Hyalella azteca]|uniref:inositol-1,4-bisphosphate 1-phosphatase n=1 Tax=Hyalella azteca TaxID=294128 RepID=A0A8B7PRJ7_HYAAZ|nr:inositol polyphosphate 1-phosphatase [Hyalella azteca]
MSLSSLLQVLVDFSAKAASIAQTIREDKELFSLLVEEKTGKSKNIRFDQDFKTLADVLIQQTLCDVINKQFPALKGRVYGEEQACFKNTMGETITVAVQADASSTAALLAQVLNGNEKAADALAQEVHKELKRDVLVSSALPTVPLEELAIWIDPIDSTAEYIKGNELTNGVTRRGLQCVTVLLGVFNTTDGRPIAGVVNQPFAAAPANGTESAATSVVWGVCGGDNSLSNATSLASRLRCVSVSSSESDGVIERLAAAGIETLPAAGAGYKALVVINSQVQAYVCSKASTYMWDTCAPHAVLLSLGGGIIPFTSLEQFARDLPPDASQHQLKYVEARSGGSDISLYCNSGGVVAYRNLDTLIALAKIIFPSTAAK